MQAAREAELADLTAKAAQARERLPEIATELATLAARRKALLPRIAEAESAWAALRMEDGRLAMEETGLQRQQGLCWQAVNRAELAGRPAVAPAPPRKWVGDSFQAALRRIFGLSLMPRRRGAARRGPALRPGEVEGVRVRFTAATTAGGVSRQAGDECIVSVADAEILAANDKATVLERGLAVPPPRPFAVRNVSSVAVSVDGATVRPGEVVMVAGETWAGVLSGAYPALGPADDGVQRMLDLECRAAELGVE